MRLWTVHEPANALTAADRADGLVFIKDGFSWLGLFFSLPWLLFNRLWLGTLLYVLVSLATGGLAEFLPLDGNAARGLPLIASLYVALEGNDLRRRKLARLGYVQIGAVTARSRLDAETQFFTAEAASKSLDPTRPLPLPPAPLPSRLSDPVVLGLFPMPGGRA